MKRNKETGGARRLARGGIRTRVYLYLMLFGVLLIVLLWLFQTVFLDSFYRGQRMRQVAATADRLAEAGDTQTMQELADSLAR